MATVNEVYKVALENRTAINTMKDLAKETEDFPAAGVLQDTDVVRVSRASSSLQTTVADIKAASGGGDLNVNADWNEADPLNDAFILNKPENLSDFNNDLPAVDVSADAYSPLDTGLITGGEVTINAGDNTKFDVSAGTGIIMDWTDPSNPIRHDVSWDAFTAEAVPDINQPFTSLYIGTTGNLIKVSGVLSSPQTRRTRIRLQGLSTGAGVILNVGGDSRPAYQVVDGILDYIYFNGALNSENHARPNSALTIDKIAGKTAFPFINRNANPQNPTVKDNPAQTTAVFIRSYRDGVGGIVTENGQTNLVPGLWDNGSGTLQAVGNNEFTIQRTYFYGQTDTLVVLYGQNKYSTLADAQAAVFTEDFAGDPILDQGAWVSAIILKGNATDVNVGTQASFVDINEFSGSGGSGGGAIGDMLKADYDTLNTGNSVDLAQSLNGFDETDFVLLDEKKFFLDGCVSKYPGNINETTLEVNDMVFDIWWSTALYVKAMRYNGGDSSLIASYTIMDSIEF